MSRGKLVVIHLVVVVNLAVIGCVRGELLPRSPPNGPCVIRRTRLPRLEPVKVGFVQYMQLTTGSPPHRVNTLSVRPPIFEIPNFLSAAECDRLVTVTQQHQMYASDIISPDMVLSDSDTDTSFSQWDINNDGLVDRNEIYGELLYLRDLHFTVSDIKTMFKKLKAGRIKKDHIHPSEFDGRKIMKYVDKLRKLDPKVKGRHSNQTWLDTVEDVPLMSTLNKRKAALTGLPLRVIESSETPAVVSYGPGGHYHCHYDSHKPTTDRPCCHLDTIQGCRVCRYITILYFLNDVEEGGQTAFPIANNKTFHQQAWYKQSKHVSNLSSYCARANLLVTPNKGTAIMWYNHVLDARTGWVGRLDPMSYHGGCDVIRGTKLIMNNWINIIGSGFEDLRPWSDKNTRIHGYS